MAEPLAKKLKPEVSRPAFKSGIVSASRSAGFDDFEDPIVIPVANKEKEYFFPASHIFSQGKFDIDTDTKHWSGKHFSEESVRDDVYTVLQSHQETIGIYFPTSSIAGSRGGKCRYSEKELKTIFQQHAKALKEDILDRPIQEKEQGLILKLTSKPGLCVHRGRYELVVGEIKQKPNYDMNWAKRQCSVHCYGVLYYYKVILGIPLDRVFGFWLCGPNCKDLQKDQKYAVGIIEVRGPDSIGKIFEGNQYTETFGLGSADGIDLLIEFLKNGNRSSFEELKGLQVSKASRGPHCFALPPSLWKNIEDNSHDKGFSIVKVGTSAMVFKLPANHLFDFIQQNVSSTQLGRIWSRFQASAKSWVQKQQSDKAAEQLYLKVRTKDTSVRFRQGFKNVWSEISLNANDSWSNISEAEKEACREFMGTYIIEPYEDANFSLCVMADRGTPLHEHLASATASPTTTFYNPRQKLNLFKTNVYLLSEHILHGDILVHNVVVDNDKNLHLVDYDEGVQAVPGKSLSRRYAQQTGDFKWLQAMFYPNSLRHFGKRYTQVQLLAFMFLSIYANESDDAWDEDCTAKIVALGSLLEEHASSDDSGWAYLQDTGEGTIPDRVRSLIDDLWNRLPLRVADTVRF